MSVRLTISSRVNVSRKLIAALRTHLRHALRLLEIKNGSWSITMIDDVAMIDLHRRTMSLATTTDVLTFNLFSGRPTGDEFSVCHAQLCWACSSVIAYLE